MTDFDVVDALAGFAEDLKSEAAFAERLHAAVVKMKAAHDTERDALVAEIKRLHDAVAEAASVMAAAYESCLCNRPIDPEDADIGLDRWLTKYAPGSLPERD